MENWALLNHSGRIVCRLDLDTREGVCALTWRKLARDKVWWALVNARAGIRLASGYTFDGFKARQAAEKAARGLGLLGPE